MDTISDIDDSEYANTDEFIEENTERQQRLQTNTNIQPSQSNTHSLQSRGATSQQLSIPRTEHTQINIQHTTQQTPQMIHLDIESTPSNNEQQPSISHINNTHSENNGQKTRR